MKNRPLFVDLHLSFFRTIPRKIYFCFLFLGICLVLSAIYKVQKESFVALLKQNSKTHRTASGFLQRTESKLQSLIHAEKYHALCEQYDFKGRDYITDYQILSYLKINDFEIPPQIPLRMDDNGAMSFRVSENRVVSLE